MFFADVDVMIACHNSKLIMMKQKDAEEWDDPLAFETIKAHGSLIINAAPKRTKANTSEELTKEERAAMKHDNHIASMIAKAPAGNFYSQNKMAEFVATTSKKITRQLTAVKYLSILKCHGDTKTAKFFDSERGEWRNNKANR